MLGMKQRKPGVTRRQLAAGIAALTPLAAQPGSRPAEELEAARGRARQNSTTLRSVRVPMLLEPSFLFKA